MLMRTLITAATTGAFMFGGSFASAADQTQDRTRTQQQSMEQEQIYGSELMTEQERSEYRSRIRDARTEQEREQIRTEHRDRMKARAQERGVTLPEEPMGSGGGMTPGGSRGSGY